MQAAINEQIALEMWSANIYLSMSAHFASLGLDGFAHWYRQQYKEELDHAEDMIQYVIRRGGQVKIQAIPAVDTEFDSALQIAEKAYAHECYVSEKIEDFFWKYIREQVEEEATATSIVDRVRLASDHAIIFLDKELSTR